MSTPYKKATSRSVLRVPRRPGDETGTPDPTRTDATGQSLGKNQVVPVVDKHNPLEAQLDGPLLPEDWLY